MQVGSEGRDRRMMWKMTWEESDGATLLSMPWSKKEKGGTHTLTHHLSTGEWKRAGGGG